MCQVERGSREVYVIRVRGQVDAERWAEWFDGMTVLGCGMGETEIRGPVEDDAALYGVLARLRDLAAPLVSVHRVRPPAQIESAGSTEVVRAGRGSRPRWVVVIVAALLAGGLTSMTTFMASERVLAASLAIALLFASLAAVVRWGQHEDGGWVWGALQIGLQAAAAITLVIFLAAERGMHAGLAAAILCFVPAVLLLRASARRR